MFFFALLLLFLLQLLTDFVASAYAIGLLTNSLPPETAAAAFLLSPLLLAVVPERLTGPRLVAGLTAAFVGARFAYPLLPGSRCVMLVAGLGVASGLLLLPLLLRARPATAGTLAGALALAVAASAALRTFGSGTDPSTFDNSQIVAWPAALALAAGAWRLRPSVPPQPVASGGEGFTAAVGLVACLTVLYFAFSSPALLPRWTGLSYAAAIALLGGAVTAFGVLARGRGLWASLTPARLLVPTALLAGCLALAASLHQVDLPDDPSGYPLPEPATGLLADVLPALAVLAVPVLFLDFGLFAHRLQESGAALGRIGGGLAAGTAVLMLLIFAQMFTTTYDYVPVVGPVLRDRFWLVLLAAGVFPALPLAILQRRSPQIAAVPWTLPLALGSLAALALAGAWLVRADPPAPPGGPDVRFLTLNVQQGYDAAGERNFEGQLHLLREVDADVIALHESDIARVSGANTDLVRYFADRLEMHSYYGPKTVNGTFGIALLSRFPIHDARTYYLYSEGEQTALITARITAAGRDFQLMVTHLGNGGPVLQQEAVLSLVPASGAVVLMGDFNFRPDTPQYAATLRLLDEAWLLVPGGANGDPRPRRIDYIFVSRGLGVREAYYVDTTESNHPGVVVTIGP